MRTHADPAPSGTPGHTCGRLAPSPTGPIHLGNAWAFLLAWLAARSRQGTVILRIEDIDPQRSRSEYADAILEDLAWLGLDWDHGPGSEGPFGPCRQSERLRFHVQAISRLEAAGRVYPCYCTRRELRTLAGAPHVGDEGAPYPGTCRNLSPAQREKAEAEGRRACLRLDTQGETVRFNDAVQGTQSFSLADCGGDFALRRSDGIVAYQLATAVDDGLMGITQVVRGRDLLPSTPRQVILLRALGHAVPTYAHVPMLLDETGERLAKRHGSLALRSLRESGVSGAAVTGLLGRLAGIHPDGAPCTPHDLVQAFSLDALPRQDIRVTEGTLADLRGSR
jgi:glutamyl-tRNA synthetase